MLASKQLASKLLPQLDRYGATEEVLSRFHFVFFGEVDNADGAGLIQESALPFRPPSSACFD